MTLGYRSAAAWSTTMANLRVPYLATRTNRNGTVRYYFQPRSKDTKFGWSAVRLHDRNELPIIDELAAAEACRSIATIYAAWQAGEPGPHRIDRLGRVAPIALASRKVARGSRYLPGQIGAMVEDYLRDEVFLQLSKKTQKEYRIYLDLFVEKFVTSTGIGWHPEMRANGLLNVQM